MSQPYTNIKEAIESVGKPYEEKRSRVNWFDALDDDRPVRAIDDISPAATTKDRAGKKEKP